MCRCYTVSAVHILTVLFDVVAGETTHNSEKRNSNSGGMSEDIKLNKSVPVSGPTKVPEKELKYTVSCGREQQINFCAGEMKVTLDARMKDSCLTFKPVAWMGKTGI